VDFTRIMQYLVRGRFLDNPSASPMEIVGLWEKIIHPSHEMLEKMVKEKKITGGCFSAQREVVFIMEAASNEAVGSILADLPVWVLIKWDVLPIQSFKSADERDQKVIDRLKKGH
jgi:hypothetical protein